MSYGNSGYAASGQAGSGMIASAQPSAPRQSLISEQMARGDKLTLDLHNLITELEARIAGVLTAEAPTGAKEASGPPSLVTLAASLGELNSRIEHACVRIGRIVQRVEL